jgi:16S rRNA (guanine966-N2)-methyltransferase
LSTLRITAGALRGRRVPVPAGETRPTSERARQAFFNIVAGRIDRARFLDLFAGSGVFAFEAVSRGAQSATAVDSDRRQVDGIARLAKEWDVPVIAHKGDALATLPRLREQFDVVYADPPYDFEAYDKLVSGIGSDLTLAPDAVVAIEHRKRTNPFSETTGRLQIQRRAEYGEVWITFFA